MSDEVEENLPLRRRVPGAARAAPAPAARPVLPDSVLRRMQAAVDAARSAGDDGPTTEPIPKITAQIPSAKTHEGNGSASDSHSRVVEFKRPAKRHRSGSSGQAKRADQPKRKNAPEPGKSTPTPRGQAPAAPATSAPEAQQSPAAAATSQTRDTQRNPAASAASQNGVQRASAAPAPTKPAAAPPWEQSPPGPSPAGTGPPPLPKRTATESPSAAARSDRDTAAAAPPADPKDASPRVLAGPAGPSAVGTVPPASSADVPAAAAEPPLLTAPPKAADTAAQVRAASRIPIDVRVPHRAGPAPASGRARRLTGIAAALVIVLVGGGIVFALATRTAPRAPGNQNASPQHREQLASRAAAVAWIRQQVSPSSVIACDPATCAALQARGYPGNKLKILGPSSTSLQSAAIVVETASVRTLLGTSLNSESAPAMLTRFGTGAAGVEIRVIAPGGAAAYQQALARERAASKSTGNALLHGGQIATSHSAQGLVVAGAVDSRLLLAIAQVGTQYPVDIIDFGNDAIGASPGLPLRYADLSEQVPAARMTVSRYVAAVAALLRQLPTGYRPILSQTVRLPRGGLAFRVEFSAPSPLNPG